MSPLRLSVFLAPGLSINTSTASENIDNTTGVFSQQTSPMTKKKDPRRRGGCAISPHLWALNLFCDSHKFQL
jgi:hypothetical protein